jgi:hypothetical protein
MPLWVFLGSIGITFGFLHVLPMLLSESAYGAAAWQLEREQAPRQATAIVTAIALTLRRFFGLVRGQPGFLTRYFSDHGRGTIHRDIP